MNLRLIVGVASIFFSYRGIAGELFYEGHVAKVADGDTFTLESDAQIIRVRFCGVDSPERRHSGMTRPRKRWAD